MTMSIQFQCEHCHKDVTAPDEAAGKRGTCPFCGQSNYVPLPLGEEDLIPLALEDEEEERRRRQEIQTLLRQERELLAEMKGQPPVPLDQRENLAGVDLHHFVVNYCLDLADGKLDRAETHAAGLRKFGPTGRASVEDFISGKTSEPALKNIPPPVLQGFLRQLKARLR